MRVCVGVGVVGWQEGKVSGDRESEASGILPRGGCFSLFFFIGPGKEAREGERGKPLSVLKKTESPKSEKSR